MNKERRQKLKNIKTRLEMIVDDLQDVLNEEQWAFDNMPENLQGSLKGIDSEDAIDNMEEAQDEINNAITSIQNAIDSLDNIT